VLNLILEDDKCFLDGEWNAQWQYLWRLDAVYPKYRKQYVTYLNHAKILHYAGDKKPWQHPELEMADKFWEFARDTVYYEEILFTNLNCKKNKNFFVNYLFPFSKIQPKSKIILYGAGEVGKTLYRQNKDMEYCKVILWVDKNYKDLTDKIDSVYGIDNLTVCPGNTYDYVLIAIDNENICRDVEAELINLGIKKEKIVWDKYRRY
ncbi:MAG: hypothetical protein J1F64_08700, partial [Oscillospiraceae bacterium]|nr:hypothetical protein [Oscillospiraceae bacterium]